jgi:hypothetical protein
MGLTIPGNAAADYTTGRIERVDVATGKFERVYDKIDGHRLSGPNDLVFDKSGGFWFSDHAKTYSRHRDHGGLYYARPDGSKLIEAAYHMVSPNGVGLSPDEKIVYMADTHTGRLWAFDIEGEGVVGPAGAGQPGRCVVTMPGYQLFDSLAVEADGRVCVATLINGGITGVGPGEGSMKFSLPDAHADFIFAVAGEEFGLAACTVLLLLFGVIVWRALQRALDESDHFIQLAASGLAVLFGLQAVINIAVSLSLMPAKGMTLPFVSYGGSSVIAAGITVGMLLALTRIRPQGTFADVFKRGR